MVERSEVERQLDEIALEHVERGIALLNEHLGPDWPNKVDQKTLDLMSPTSCVLGQLFADVRPTEEQFVAASEHNRYLARNVRAVLDTHPDDLSEIEKTTIGSGYNRGLIVLDGDALVDPDRFGFSLPDAMSDLENDYIEDSPRAWGRLTAVWRDRLDELEARVSA